MEQEILAQELSKYIRVHLEPLAEKILQRQEKQQPRIFRRFTFLQYEHSLNDTKYNLDYLAQAIANQNPNGYKDYIAWLISVLLERRVPEECLSLNLVIIKDVLAEELSGGPLSPDGENMLQEYIDPALEAIKAEVNQPPYLDESMPHYALAKKYLDAVIQGDRHYAIRIILEAVRTGISIKDVYSGVLRPVQYEVGRQWQINKINVAQEHYASVITQLVMSQLYPFINNKNKTGYSMVATCVGSELHEIGVHMVADFFEMAGWETYFIGANTPYQSVVTTLEYRKPDLLAISATLSTHIPKVQEMIEAIRKSKAKDILILVGGHAFNQEPNLWKKIGADGYAPDADQAILISEKLLAVKNH